MTTLADFNLDEGDAVIVIKNDGSCLVVLGAQDMAAPLTPANTMASAVVLALQDQSMSLLLQEFLDTKLDMAGDPPN